MAEINFLPVCSACRAILDDQEIDYRPIVGEIEQAPNGVWPAPEHEIISNRCPKCGKTFDRIVMYTDVPVHPTRRLTI